MARPVLYPYFEKTAAVLKSHFERSGEQHASANLGKNREYFCSHFLKNILPTKLNITSGEIWDSYGHKTGQIDLIITREDAPALDFGNENTYLAEGVFGVIEVKSNLDRAKLIEAANTMKKVEKLRPNYGFTLLPPNAENINRPLRLVFAYTSATWDTLLNEIYNAGLSDSFDLICVLDKGVYINKGRLLKWDDLNPFAMVNGQAASLGILYYYLVSYANSFVARGFHLSPYFEPFNEWGY